MVLCLFAAAWMCTCVLLCANNYNVTAFSTVLPQLQQRPRHHLHLVRTQDLQTRQGGDSVRQFTFTFTSPRHGEDQRLQIIRTRTTCLFEGSNNNNNSSSSYDGKGRGLILLGFIVVLNLWLFSIPPEFLRAHMCPSETAFCGKNPTQCEDCFT
jgi:hypothetical protein